MTRLHRLLHVTASKSFAVSAHELAHLTASSLSGSSCSTNTPSLVRTNATAAAHPAPALPLTKHELRESSRAPRSPMVSTLDAQERARSGNEASTSAPDALLLDDALFAGLEAKTGLTREQHETVRLLRRFGVGQPELKGQQIQAKVLVVRAETVLVDAGYYGLSEVPRDKLSVKDLLVETGSDGAAPRASMQDVRVGDVVKLVVESTYSPYGDMQLMPVQDDPQQRRRAVWAELRRMMAARQNVIGRVLNDCPGGYAVGVAGFVALLPYARASAKTIENIGSTQYFTIMAMDDRRRSMLVADTVLRRRY